MGFFDWYLKCIKDHYADFDGRARRTEYWMYTLVNIIVYVVLDIIFISMIRLPVIPFLYALAVLVPGLAVSVRRLHDIDKSGWWLLIGLIPLIGAIWLIVLFATEGNRVPNQYGPDPKEGVA